MIVTLHVTNCAVTRHTKKVMNVNATPHLPPASSVAASVITRPELARLLKVSVRTVDRMIAEGEIRVVHVRGKIVRILKADVERFLEGKAESGKRESGN